MNKVPFKAVEILLSNGTKVTLEDIVLKSNTVPYQSMAGDNITKTGIVNAINYLKSRNGGIISIPANSYYNALNIEVHKDKNGEYTTRYIYNSYRHPQGNESRPYTNDAWQKGDIVYNTDMVNADDTSFLWFCKSSGTYGQPLGQARDVFLNIVQPENQSIYIRVIPQGTIMQSQKIPYGTYFIPTVIPAKGYSTGAMNITGGYEKVGDNTYIAKGDINISIASTNKLNSDIEFDLSTEKDTLTNAPYSYFVGYLSTDFLNIYLDSNNSKVKFNNTIRKGIPFNITYPSNAYKDKIVLESLFAYNFNNGIQDNKTYITISSSDKTIMDSISKLDIYLYSQRLSSSDFAYNTNSQSNKDKSNTISLKVVSGSNAKYVKTFVFDGFLLDRNNRSDSLEGIDIIFNNTVPLSSSKDTYIDTQGYYSANESLTKNGYLKINPKDIQDLYIQDKKSDISNYIDNANNTYKSTTISPIRLGTENNALEPYDSANVLSAGEWAPISPWELSDTEITSMTYRLIKSSLPSETSNEVTKQLNNKLPTNVSNEVTKQLNNTLPTKVSTEVSSQLTSKLPTSVSNEVTKQLDSKLPDKVETQVNNVVNPLINQAVETITDSKLPTLTNNYLNTKLPNSVSTEVSSQLPTKVDSSVKDYMNANLDNAVTKGIDKLISSDTVQAEIQKSVAAEISRAKVASMAYQEITINKSALVQSTTYPQYSYSYDIPWSGCDTYHWCELYFPNKDYKYDYATETNNSKITVYFSNTLDTDSIKALLIVATTAKFGTNT